MVGQEQKTLKKKKKRGEEGISSSGNAASHWSTESLTKEISGKKKRCSHQTRHPSTCASASASSLCALCGFSKRTPASSHNPQSCKFGYKFSVLSARWSRSCHDQVVTVTPKTVFRAPTSDSSECHLPPEGCVTPLRPHRTLAAAGSVRVCGGSASWRRRCSNQVPRKTPSCSLSTCV